MNETENKKSTFMISAPERDNNMSLYLYNGLSTSVYDCASVPSVFFLFYLILLFIGKHYCATAEFLASAARELGFFGRRLI